MRWWLLAVVLSWSRAARADDAGLDDVMNGFLGEKAAVSADGRTVALPARTHAHACGDNVEVVLAPLGEIAGDRFLIKTSGKCPGVVAGAAEAGTAALRQRIASAGFRRLDEVSGDTEGGDQRVLAIDELDLEVREAASTFVVTVKHAGEVVAQAEVERPTGVWNRYALVPTYGATPLVYMRVMTERNGADHQRIERLETWTVLALTRTVPVPMVASHSHGTVEDTEAARATLAARRGKQNVDACQRGELAQHPPYVLVRCDERLVLLGRKARVLLDERVKPRATLVLELLQAPFGDLVCLEVEQRAADGGGDRVVCFDGKVGRRVLEVSDPRRLEVRFFHGKPPYARVQRFPDDQTRRLRWRGKRFQ